MLYTLRVDIHEVEMSDVIHSCIKWHVFEKKMAKLYFERVCAHMEILV
jgi:hypothetical protein